MRIHFIAIGGAAMHNLALALHNNGHTVTGSDDEIFEPSKSRLQKAGLLPEKEGWFPEKITNDIDVVILGMHAHPDNPELLQAQKLNIPVYSYPEFIARQSINKKRVVIGGSHGKSTTTSMILHVLKSLNKKFDYLVGAQIEGFDTMVKLSDAPLIILEGDEYLSSPIDRRPKFLWYKPHVAVLTGVAWDHINVFPTFEEYTEQFKKFVQTVEPNGVVNYYKNDDVLAEICQPKTNPDIRYQPYDTHPYEIIGNKTYLLRNDDGSKMPLQIFGDHNLQNLQAAYFVCKELEISDDDFYQSIQSFKGAAKRLEKVGEHNNTVVFKDFAHSPSKLQATIEAVKQQYPERKLIAVIELHTYSSLNKDFLPQYAGTLQNADEKIVYFNPHTIELKRLPNISETDIKNGFSDNSINIFKTSEAIQNKLKNMDYNNSVVLFMSSGNYGGMNVEEFTKEFILKI
ncbi:MAG TPA: peptidoglycan synthetase [Flavobacteriales bacterium]|nr:peptidoglycan synthetase [Flavobacteriales bacterium]|tara:strand:- start:31525 stop:32895 length:1371 start_codon:yes stop_codon:yes gene_type:complete